MKLGVITDIHNNPIALRAVLDRLNQLGCDRIICCGDIIGIGPCPEETVQAMMRLPCLTAVRGNHETYLLEGMPEEEPNEERMSREEMAHHRWEHALLSESSVRFLASLPYSASLVCDDLRISVLHYCMDRDGHYTNYTPSPSAEDLARMFAGLEGDIILYGHDHARTICRADRWYVNAGSLGCPGRDRNIARACVITIEKGAADVQPLDVEYDADEVIRRIDALRYPEANNIKTFFYGVG